MGSVKDLAGNGLGGTIPFNGETYVLDRAAPSTPVLQTYPHNPANSRSATFTWTGGGDVGSGPPTGFDHFMCSVENGAFFTCSSGYTFQVSGPDNSQHQFAVESVDHVGNVSGLASYKWKVDQTQTVKPYTISGSPTTLLYPTNVTANAVPINVTFSNTNSDSVQVNNLTVSFSVTEAAGATGPYPCTTNDFVVTQFGGSYPFYIPVGSSSLSSLGFPSTTWPTIRMKDSGTNQDRCKGATVHLSYGGSS